MKDWQIVGEQCYNIRYHRDHFDAGIGHFADMAAADGNDEAAGFMWALLSKVRDPLGASLSVLVICEHCSL